MCICQPANAKTTKELREERVCSHIMPRLLFWTGHFIVHFLTGPDSEGQKFEIHPL